MTYHSFPKTFAYVSTRSTPPSFSGIHSFINKLVTFYHEPDTELDPETTEMSHT